MVRVSIKDIAQELGISTASVSLVLNGKEKEGRVGKVLAEKVRQKAKEMNYEPNNLARGLRMGCSNTIGFVVADISNVFFANLAFHIQEQAESLGYSVIITNTNESNFKMEKMINVLKSRLVDGLIIVPTEHGNACIEDLVKKKMPVVLIDRYFPKIQVNSVVVDNYNASRQAIEILINQGCRKIGVIIYKSTLQHMADRERGCIEMLKKHGIYEPALIKEIDYVNISEDIAISIERLLSKENKVDGIFFATNTLSMLGIRQLLEANIKLPDDMKVVCFDKSDAFDFTTIPIPYIQQPIPEMGKIAVELLIEQIKKQSIEPKHLELQTTMKNLP